MRRPNSYRLVLGVTGAVNFIARLTRKPVVRGLTLGLGLTFIVEGARLMRDAPVLAAIGLAITFLLLAEPRIRDANAFDGVLIGEQIDDKLHYRGVVEWGFRAADVLEVLRTARMFDTRTSPFVDLPAMHGAVWLEPRLRAEVSYAEVIGGRLRAPSWRRLIDPMSRGQRQASTRTKGRVHHG
jgi:hypothetical protein